MCDFWLFRTTESGGSCLLPPLATLANLATASGVIFAIVAAGIAYASYRRSAKDAAASHMHGLFRDYLRLRMEWSRQTDREEASSSGQLVAFKLYTLEEMYGWVDRHRPPKLLRRFYRYNMSNIRGWERTIVYHLKEDEKGQANKPARSVKSLSDYAECYGDKFLLFAMAELGPDLIEALELKDLKRTTRLKILLREQIARRETCP